ncbi:hypothetical protein niasHS_000957 [Heterodera schachtii]|uniref:receptor protein serine/threonine kinase n=1 Tax=Heterodera schachtii TaxID=97005 RepID=A0ABD2K7U0_HETSC
MFSLFPSVLFLLLHHIDIYSTDQIEDKKNSHKELDAEIRTLFNETKDYIPPAFRLHSDELLCKCNHYANCGKEGVASYVGEQYMDVCRPGRGGYCSRVVFLNADGTIREVITSCLKREQLVPRELPFVCQNSTTPQWNKLVNCCKTESFCNDIQFPIELGLRNGFLPESFDGLPSVLLTLLISLVLVLLFALSLCVAVSCCCFPRKRAVVDRCIGWLVQCRSPTLNSSKADCEMDSESLCGAPMGQLAEAATFSTGSGSGVPMLAPRTISYQISLQKVIGKGRFGEVTLGEWRGEKVAVKIFESREVASFDRETTIYRDNMLRHQNLLRWISSDTVDTGEGIMHWLVTDYCPNGSLLGHLENNTLNTQQCLQFIRSIAHGIDYLHTSLTGTKNFFKPSIAHRDLKPGNILIKNDWTCCIADLGMCVRLKSDGIIDRPEGGDRGGTARYLAPEFLDKSYSSDSITSYMRMDIYALALVIWEICRRVEVNNLVSALDYQVPYQEYELTSSHPSPDAMKQIVCVEGLRPTIPKEWSKTKILNEFTRIIKECWNAMPQSRLTALSIRCTIDRMCTEENIIITTT